MRASEVCNLELKDVDLKNGEITIRRLKSSLKTTQPLADVPGQPLLSERLALRAYLAERGNHPSKFVFVSQKSGHVHRSQFYRIFASAAEKAGLPADRRHPHVLKHSLGVALVEANVNLAVIKQALGHKSFASRQSTRSPRMRWLARRLLPRWLPRSRPRINRQATNPSC
jgi:integrase